MAKGAQNQEGVPENLRRQLAVAVRSVQWSYAIFWSMSTKQQRVLEWGDGYYNGDIKTWKTVQAMELKADKMGLQRSEQLRELYECLLEGETDQQATIPTAALSPDDLTDAEWYYLVCMSFVFSPGQDLPGRALANGQPIWLCNAHSADSKVFSRSLLAKSASIQTVICFPHLGHVIELGVTELVAEDPSLIQHIKTSLLEFSKPVCSEISSSSHHNKDDDVDFMHVKVDHEVVNKMEIENLYPPTEVIGFDHNELKDIDGNIQDDFTMGSPYDCSNGCEHNHQTDDSFHVDGGTSQVQSWHFIDDDFSNCVQDSMNSSDCISQAVVNQETDGFSPPKGDNMSLNELKECNNTKSSYLDLRHHDVLHYKRTLSAVLMRNSHWLLDGLCFRSCEYKSSFVSWKKGEIANTHRPKLQQKMLKKILFDIPLLHDFPDKRMENERFLILRSMVPSINQVDKASILGDTIEYLNELDGRVEELESCIDLAEHEAKGTRKYPDVVDKTSENNENMRIDNKKPWINKRKACDIDETDPKLSSVVPKDEPLKDMKVKIKEQEVLIEMLCPSREYLLLIDALNHLNFFFEPSQLGCSLCSIINR